MKKQPPGEAQVVKKRFIAGAVCPDCQALDRLVVEYAVVELYSAEFSRRRCVACGFVETYNEVRPTTSAGVPRGRPDRPERPDGKNQQTAHKSQIVRILDPTRD